MAESIKNVIVVGATGRLGPHVLKALKDSGKFNVSILARHDSTSEYPAEFPVLRTDYSHDSLVTAFKGQDAIVSAVSSPGIKSQPKLIDAAIDAKVQRFIPSEFGSDTDNPRALSLFGHWVEKKKIGDYCVEKQDQLAWTRICTGVFFDMCLEMGLLGPNMQKKTAVIYNPPYNSQPFAATTLATVGLAVARTLENANTRNRTIYVRSVNVSQNQILEAVQKATTNSPWPVERPNLDELVAKANEGMKKGDFSGLGSIIIQAAMDKDTGMDFDKTKKPKGLLFNEELGLPEETLDGVVKEYLAAHKE